MRNLFIAAVISIFLVFIYGIIEIIVFPHLFVRWILFALMLFWIPILLYVISKN
jgi:hypothetical protein